MTRILIFLFVSSLLLNVSPCFSQGNNQTIVVPPSPDVFKFTKYGDLPIDYSSGAMSFNIPVYTISLGTFSMPLSLNYFSNGIKVDDAGASYGVNWMLNGGGAITRVIRGAPDEQGGYYSLQRMLSSDQELSYAASSPGVDTERDWFMFNFNGIGGTFYLDENLQAQYTCDTKLKIETKIITEPPPNLGGDLGIVGRSNILTFKITTPDGTAYEFGGQQYAERNLQVGFTFDPLTGWYNGYTQSGYQTAVDPVTGFFLKSITTHTGTKILFEYRDNRYKALTSVTQHAVIENSSYYTSESSGLVYWRSFYLSKMLSKILVKQPGGELATTIDFASSSSSVFDRFNTNDGPDRTNIPFNFYQIIFNNPFETNPSFALTPLQMDSIIVKDYTGKKIQSVSLWYNGGSLAGRQYLNSVSLMGNSAQDSLVYTFEYNNASLLPSVLSRSQDYYGYYNGKSNQGLIIEPSVSDGLLSTSLRNSLVFDGRIFGDREPVADYVSYGMLSRIIYPTKGYTDIEYEPNYGENRKLFGGARVKYIRDFDGFSHSQLKEFYYHALMYYPAVRSSIVPTIEPRFYDLPLTTMSGFSQFTLSSSSVNSIYSNRKSNHLYNYVTVIFKDEFGYPVGATERVFNTEADPYPQVVLKDLLFSTPASNVNAWKSGLILNEKKYTYNNSNGNFELKEELKNVYDKFNERQFSNYVVRLIVKDMPGIRSSYSLNGYQEGACDFRKTSDTLIAYTSSGNFIKSTVYVFGNDSLAQLKEIRTKDSKNGTNITRYTYVQDLTVRTSAEDSLLKKFRINSPLMTQKFEDTFLLSTSTIKFKDWGNGLIAPEKVSESFMQAPMRDMLFFNAYDRSGNVLELQKTNEPKESYFWGYNDMYPVAKVIGKSYNDIKNLVDLSLLKNTNGIKTNTEIRTELNKLYTTIPSSALVNTYTYIPLIGMASETDHSRKTTFYEYDGSNRLSRLRDDDNAILKQYNYKFSEQTSPGSGGTFSSKEKKGVYYKNNCLSGQVGSLVTFNVAAGAFTSTVSQADADRKAQEEVYKSGQAYANTNGNCTGAPNPVIIYQNAAKQRIISKNDCVAGVTIPISYLVIAGKYQSDISQADADRKAETEINLNGQAYANTNGVCMEQLSGPMDGYFVDPFTGTSYTVGTYYYATNLQELCKFYDPTWIPPVPGFPVANPVPTPTNPVVQISIAIYTITTSTVLYSHMVYDSFAQITLPDFAPDGYYVNKQATRIVPAGQRVIYELKDGKLYKLVVCQ